MKNQAIPLKRSLMFNLTAGVLLLGAILLGISLVATDRAVERLSGALTNRIIATTDAQLLTFFEPVQSAIEVTAERVHSGEFTEFPVEAMDRYYVPLIERMPQLSSVMYAHGNGDEYMLLKTGGTWVSRLTRPDSWGPEELLREWQDADGERGGERRPLDYDARRRPWYQGALQRFEALGEDAPYRDLISWTAPYKFFTTQEPGVTASIALRAIDGRILVLGFDILLSDISQFTSRIAIGERGKVFVLRGQPQNPEEMVVIGLPADDRFEDEGTMIDFVLSPPHGLGGPVASFVSDGIGESPDPVGAPVRFEHEGESWWGEIAQSQLETTDNVWIGAVLPESELLEGLPDTSMIVVAATLLVLLLAVLRASRVARRYASPLEDLTERGNRMQRLNFEPVESVDSDISEIRHLSATLERMRAALHTFSMAREDLRVAREIRSMAVQSPLPEIDGLDISIRLDSAERVGGESFDVVRVPESTEGDEHVIVALFDLPGTGLQAAIGSHLLRIVFRSAVREGADLGGIARQVDDFIRADYPELEALRFWLLDIDPAGCRASAIGAGYGPVLCRVGETVEQIDSAPGMLGMSPATPLPAPFNLELAPNALLIAASDGVVDALDQERRRFGSDGLIRALEQSSPAATPGEIIDRITRDLSAHAGDVDGDRTVLAIRYTVTGG